jgi:hypothetical protein
MALRLSTGFTTQNVGTRGVKDMLEGGFLDIYSGAQPVDADKTETGTKLVSINTGTVGTGGLTFGTAASGILPKSADAWSGTVGSGGVAGWARFYCTPKLTGTSGTSARMDMVAGLSGSELVLSHTNLVADTVLTIKTFSLTVPSE